MSEPTLLLTDGGQAGWTQLLRPLRPRVVRTAADVKKAYADSTFRAGRWIAADWGALRHFVAVVDATSRPRRAGRLLVLKPVEPLRRVFADAIFEEVVAPAKMNHLLSARDL